MDRDQGMLVFVGGIVVFVFLLAYGLFGSVPRTAFSLLYAVLLAAGTVYFFLLARETVRSLARYVDPEDESSRRPTIVGKEYLLPLIGTVVAVVLVLAPEIVRVGSGATRNPGWDPPVVGPGDTARLEFPQSIQAFKSKWAGEAQIVSATIRGRGEAQGFTVSSRKRDWGDSIRGKSSKTEPWVDVSVPDDTSLEGAAVRFELKLSVTFPMQAGSGSFEESNEIFVHKATLILSSAGAGGTYRMLWYLGTILGVLLFFTSAWFLLRDD